MPAYRVREHNDTSKTRDGNKSTIKPKTTINQEIKQNPNDAGSSDKLPPLHQPHGSSRPNSSFTLSYNITFYFYFASAKRTHR